MSRPTPGMIRIERDGAVARITIEAPQRLNAVDAAMLQAIADAVAELSTTDGVRVIAITGAGRGFCSGASLTGAITDPEVGEDTLIAAAHAVQVIAGSPVPVVALVNGVAAGVGCSLALATHYVLATESAAFMLAFARIGLMPDGGATATVAASIGRARALRLALNGERLPATTAAEWGLIAEVADDDRFTERSSEVLAGFARAAPQALAATVAAIDAAVLPDLAGALAREEPGQRQLLAGNDFREGVAAFTERRPPRFGGTASPDVPTADPTKEYREGAVPFVARP